MFIINQDWNDPKSKLQQCCLTLRTIGGGEPDIPIYKFVKLLHTDKHGSVELRIALFLLNLSQILSWLMPWYKV